MADEIGVEQAALDRIMADWDAMAEATASRMGMPPGGKRYTEQEQLEMWNYSPIATPGERVTAMVQLYSLGKTVEEITDAIYPKRRQAIETSHPNPKRRVAYARDMVKAMERQAAQLGMQIPSPDAPAALPVPPLAAPMLPTAPVAGPEPPMMPAPVGASQPAAASPLDVPFNSLVGG